MAINCNVYKMIGVTNTGLWRLLIYANYAYDFICFSKVAHLVIKKSLVGWAGNDVSQLQCCSSAHLAGHTLITKKRNHSS